MLRQQSRYDDIWQKVYSAMEGFQGSSKGKLNVIFLAHDVIRKVRGGTQEERGNEKLMASPLIQAGYGTLYRLLDHIEEDSRQSVRTSYGYIHMSTHTLLIFLPL
jgi:hypothetical protein